MRLTSLARRYAHALFGAARKQSAEETVLNDLILLKDTFLSNDDLSKTVNSPIVSDKKKKQIMKDLFGDKISSLAMDFVCLVIDKKRENIIPYVKEEYDKIYSEAISTKTLVIESVIYLDEDQKMLLTEKMEKKFSCHFRPVNIINKDLIGGVRIRVDDTVIDGSVRNRLNMIEEYLTK